MTTNFFMVGCKWSVCQEISDGINAQIHCVLGHCFTDTEFYIRSNIRSAVTLLILLKMFTLCLSLCIKYIFMLHFSEV